MSIGSNDHTVRILLIFVTGGCVLALELISSRVMTSFFGVSLYIWTSILSVTLLFLAIGYMVGGNGGEPPVRQKRGFLIFFVPGRFRFGGCRYGSSLSGHVSPARSMELVGRKLCGLFDPTGRPTCFPFIS